MTLAIDAKDPTLYRPAPQQIEDLLNNTLANIGIEHVVFSILDPAQTLLLEVVKGFTPQQIETYQQYQHHDIYLATYLHRNLKGNLLYLQEIVPLKQITDEIFHDVLLPTIQLRHTYSGLCPLSNNHTMLLSCHSFRALTVGHLTQLDRFWQLLAHWSNAWVAQITLQHAWQQWEGEQHSAENQPLTPAESDVLQLLVGGFSGSEIAQQRDVSKETVRSQIKQLLRKTGCRHQNQLISRYSGYPILHAT
ncbi:hypothetical protein ABT56_14340 [Photobacterium aquae]|uniref:HTH luxR-type domain-containing protein n=1 Tax=Photobacterium aquae TaxID=1195763 RepID=A0A0J1GY94_9GAMM|nr:helix-turn-helix transcriptional regulator [Photobacterium aquae]KLV04636.1 hypothetical protein ABT56_14340 [Photobacterium aquae]